jgi:hypothetical protein
MKKLILYSCIFLTRLVFSQCGTYEIIPYSSHYSETTTSIGSNVTSQNIMVLNNLNVTYQWYKNNSPISNGIHYSGVTTNQLSINNVNFSDDGDLECYVTNITDGCKDTASFYIDVCVGISQQPSDVNTNINSTATFSTNHNYPNATYHWLTDLGTGYHYVTNSGQYSGANTNTLTVSYVTMANNNQHFYCEIGSTCDNSLYTDTVVLLINTTNSILENYKAKFYISPNPITNTFSINGIESLYNVTSINIKDINGKVVKNLDPQNLNHDIQNLSPGVYFVQVKSSYINETIKIIKQ